MSAWATMDTALRVEAVRSGMERGVNPRILASEMGTTRNAVLGLAHRNKIVFPRPVQPKRERVRAKPKTRARPDTPTLVVDRPVQPRAWKPHCEPVSLLELADHTCRWPVGDAVDAKQMFCGDQVHRRGYCEHHWGRRNKPAAEFVLPEPSKITASGVLPEVTLRQAVAYARGAGRSFKRGGAQ